MKEGCSALLMHPKEYLLQKGCKQLTSRHCESTSIVPLSQLSMAWLSHFLWVDYSFLKFRSGWNIDLNLVHTSGVARTWVMPGPSSFSLPVERRATAISLREARKIFAFIFQLSGWALVAPSCFVLMYVRIYIVFTLHAPNHMHALTATCMHCRML